VEQVSGSTSDRGDAGTALGNADEAVRALITVLRDIDPGRPRRALVGPGHYASVIAIDDRTGIALCTDGVGTKLIVAEQASRFDTVGIDCVAMNVNDVICVGAEPLALVDYIAVESADPGVLRTIGEGLRTGAEAAGVEIPGGELAVVPEMIRGHPSPHGLDLVGSCFGVVGLDAIVSGGSIEPGDAVIGLPSSGIHSNGLTLARSALLDRAGYSLDDTPAKIGRSLTDELLEPTTIYVRPVLELLRSGVRVHGLAHITGDGLLNLVRLSAEVGYRIDDPLPDKPIFGLIESAGSVPRAEMYQTFNMGTGFCCIVAEGDLEDALVLLRRTHPEAKRIGQVTSDAATVALPADGLIGRDGAFKAA
jgi:phosphoribosylformylglycinamidine cyclo-ligase